MANVNVKVNINVSLDPHVQPFWEKGYQDLSVSCMGGPSFEVAEVATLLSPKSKVLDLGCGEGRNALYLASLGCQVTAVDRSEAGIRKLQMIARNSGIQLKTIVADINSFNIEGEFDCIMAHGVLNYLDKPLSRKLISQIKLKTRAGGFNIFTLYIYNEEFPCTNEMKTSHYRNSFLPNELHLLYEDWHEVRYDKYVKWDSHPGIPMHYHPVEKLVSQKPGGDNIGRLVKIPISCLNTISNNLFHGISMGLTEEDVYALIGKPEVVDKMNANGIQFGMSLYNPDRPHPTVEGYTLQLWYYGKYVVYVSNGLVSGKALYYTQPIRIICS